MSKRVKIPEALPYLLQFVNTFLPKRIDNSSEVFYTTSVSKRVKILGRLSIDLIVAAIIQCSSFFVCTIILHHAPIFLYLLLSASFM